MTRRASSPVLGLALLCLASCSTNSTTTDTTAADDARTLLGLGESGLLVRELRYDRDPNPALTVHAAPFPESDSNEQGSANGLRVSRIPMGELETLLADLGRPLRDVEGWHGQAYDWRDVLELDLGDATRAVVVNGRARRYSGGWIRLVLRGWVLPMETGPRVQVDLVPVHDRERRPRLIAVLGGERRGRAIADAAFGLVLEPGYAYVLTAAPVEAVPNPMGPAAVGPATIGDMLFRTESDEARHVVLLLVPRIPESFGPPRRDERASPIDGAPS